MNKCNVSFQCTGSKKTCEFYVDCSEKPTSPFHNGCKYYYKGDCICKQAKIKALIDEGLIKPYDIVKSNSIGGN